MHIPFSIKVGTESVSSFEEIDETKNIDPDLYLVDMKNKSKYSKIFRKVTEIPKHDEYFPNSLVSTLFIYLYVELKKKKII